jgi:hypothetical protein
MNFVSYETLLYAALKNLKTPILSLEKTCFLNAVNICNVTNTNIRINLKIIRLLANPTVENYIVKDVLIQPNESKNLLSLGNLEIFLENGDSLLCFSNGYSEIFDCTICYSLLNET